MPRRLVEILDLPDKVFPVAGLCVGYPAAAGHISMRLPLEATVHLDRYQDRQLGEAVDAYDRRRDARYSVPRDQQRSPDVFGCPSFYGWSEDKARQAAQPEGLSFPGLFAHTRFHPGLAPSGLALEAGMPETTFCAPIPAPRSPRKFA